MHQAPAMQGFATVPATSDAKAYLQLLFQHKAGLICAIASGVLLAWLYLAVTPPVYEASALVEVRESGNLLEEERDEPVNWNAPTIKEEANILQSRRVLAPVVDAYDLRTITTAHRVPLIGELIAHWPLLGEYVRRIESARRYAWGDETLVIAALDVPLDWEDDELTLRSLGNDQYRLLHDGDVLIEQASTGENVDVELSDTSSLLINVASLNAAPEVEFTVRRQSLEEAIRTLRDNMSTETTDSKSRMITVKFRGDDAQETAVLTNAIVSQYQAVKLGSENLQTTVELDFYEQSLPQVEEELRGAEEALANYRRGSGAIKQDTQVAAKLGQIDALETEMTELEIERDELLERYTAAHPSLRRLEQDIDVLQRKIDQVRSAVQDAPDTERELTVLMQQEETARRVYNEMNEKLQKLRIAQAGNVGSVQIWDEALAPKKPVWPSTLLALTGFTLVSVFLYLLFLTLRSALSTVIDDQDSLQRASGLPVFINIPLSNAQRRLRSPGDSSARRMLTSRSAENSAAHNILALSKPEDYSVENLRSLRSMLEDMSAGAINNAIMFTSPLPSMGKSFISVNLAVLLAQSGKRVLLIDADYHRGHIHKTLGIDNGPGLPEVVSGKAELKDAVRITSIPQLYCIARGYTAGDVAREVPGDRQMQTFMQVVAPRFDNLVIDTPPVLSVATAASIGKHVGSTIMVVKENEVKEPQVVEALKRLTFSGVRVNGCILNSASVPTPRHYAYYREPMN